MTGHQELMVPKADFRSYYGLPVISEPVWRVPEVPGYLFLGGLAGASSALAASADLSGRPQLARTAKTAAAAAIGLSAVALVADLGRPARFHHMLRVFKPTSPMSVGSWLLAAYGPAAGVAAASALTGLLPGTGRVATAAAAVTGPGVAAYTAALLSDTAVPAWHDAHRELPYLFVSSAATAAGGLGLIMAPPDQAAPARNLALAGAAAELTAKSLLLRRLGPAAEPYQSGRAGRLMEAAEILTAAGLTAAAIGARNRPVAALAGAALLTSSALTRFGVFYAGLTSARDPEYTVAPQKARIRDRLRPAQVTPGPFGSRRSFKNHLSRTDRGASPRVGPPPDLLGAKSANYEALRCDGQYARLAVLRFRKGKPPAIRRRCGGGQGAALVPRDWRVPGRRLGVGLLLVVGTAACSGGAPQQTSVILAAHTRLPASATSVLAGPPDVVAGGVARALFASAPVVVVTTPGGLGAAARAALRAHAPLLLTSSTGTSQAGLGAVLRAPVKDLNPQAVLAVGVAKDALAAALPGVRVVTDPSSLPATKAPASQSQLALLVQAGVGDPATAAAVATARVAGARVITVHGGDPRADPAAIAALSAARPRQVLAIGGSFGSAAQLASRIASAQTGVQLPGGGQVLFPHRMLVALYGHPGAPALGALGRQGLTASIARARNAAAAYRPLSRVPVIPAFEIIATVAEAHPGADGTYSYQAPVSLLRPWVRQATAAGMYVILDLQPGRASLLTQAKSYQSLLELPDVGLALDAEWKLQPGQVPLHQIGSVSITEVNSVVSWLAALTAQYRLPQKLLVLHQFRLSMIRGERSLDTRHDDLAILIHMDGQGSQGDKRSTWAAVTGAAPAGVFFGWKDFYVQDHPMMSPRQTMARTPRLSMVSYQ